MDHAALLDILPAAIRLRFTLSDCKLLAVADVLDLNVVTISQSFLVDPGQANVVTLLAIHVCMGLRNEVLECVEHDEIQVDVVEGGRSGGT